jgi:hypothetical protein
MNFFEPILNQNRVDEVGTQSRTTNFRKQKLFFNDLELLLKRHNIILNTDKEKMLKKFLSQFDNLKEGYCHDCSRDKDILQKKIKSLHLKDRDSVISCLSLVSNSKDAIDNVMVTAYPFLAERGQQLLEKPARKERFDAIDLNIISNFMHNLCR